MRTVSRLVPSDQRKRWLEEWCGELWSTLQVESPAGARQRLGLVGRCRGALRDALASRRLNEPAHDGGPGFEPAGGQRRTTARPAIIESLVRDLRTAFRSLRHNPGFATIVVLVFAIGIGANATMFGVIDAVLLRPLNLPDSERLVLIRRAVQGAGQEHLETSIPAPAFRKWKENSQTLVGLAAVHDSGWLNILYLSGVEEPERLDGALVSPGFFTLLGAEAALGRTFTDRDDPAELRWTTVLSHDLWVRRFAADPGIVSTSIRLNGEPYSVLGVMPEEFKIDDPAGGIAPDPAVDLWVPLAPEGTGDPRLDASYDQVLARVSPAATVVQAEAELDSLYPAREGERDRLAGVRLISLREQMVGHMRAAFTLLAGVVGLVLMLACVNIAGLQLARASERSREVAIRSALGATRLQILRQAMVEGWLLALFGGIGALLSSRWSIDLFVAFAPASVPRLDEVRIDWRVFAFTLVLALAAGSVSVLMPARQISGGGADRWLERGRGATSGRDVGRARAVLVVAQVALAMLLLVGGGLLARSFWELNRVEHGINPDGVLTVDIYLSNYDYEYQSPEITSYFNRVRAAAAAVPGVSEVTLTTSVPFRPRDYYRPSGRWRIVDDAYFDLLDIPIVRGRGFLASDVPGGEPVAVINQTLARQVFGDRDPIGLKLREDEPDDPAPTVVGIVADVRHASVDAAPLPAEYSPFSQVPDWRMTLLVKVISRLDPLSLAGPLRQALWEIDPDQPLANVSTIERLLRDSEPVRTRRFYLQVLGVFALVAIALALMGIYGVVARSVVQRSREMGLRVALGASPGDVVRLILGRGARLAALGTAAGAVAGLTLTRFMASWLYEVPAADPVTFAAVGSSLFSVAMLACYLPARRATRVDPVVVLAAE